MKKNRWKTAAGYGKIKKSTVVLFSKAIKNGKSRSYGEESE